MSKSNFRTVYCPPDKVSSVSGLPDRPDYKPSPIDGSAYDLIPDGLIHSYDEIQSHANECDFEKVIDMYQKTGDESILQRRASFYDEEGVIPSDYRELRKQIARADELFKGLPTEIRSEYGNSPSVFYSNPSNLLMVESYYQQKAKATKPAPVPSDPVPVPADPVKESDN